MPTIRVSRIKKAIMNSLTRSVIDTQLAAMQSTDSSVAKMMKNMEMPSIPR